MISLPVRSDVFVGRVEELAFLLERVEDVRGGASSCVLVRGSQGSGKTRLIEELRARSSDVSFEIVRCEREKGGEQVRQALRSAALHAVQVVVFEDVDRCGREGIEALESVENPRTLRIACFTSNETEIGFEQAIARLQLSGAYEIVLSPLSDAEMRKLASQLRGNGMRLSRAKGARIVEFASGNPGLAIQLARAYAARYTESGEIPIPDVLRVRVRDLLDSIGPAEQSVILVASLIDSALDIDMLARVAQQSRRAVVSALQRASLAGIVREVTRGRFVFESPLSRQAVRAHATPTWASEYHLRLARTLEHASDPQAVESAARHFSSAGDRERAAALHERVAQDLLAQRDYVGAARNFRAASELLSGTPRGGEALARLAQALRRGGFEDDALRIYQEIVTGDSAATDSESKARALSNIMQLSYNTGDLAKAEALGRKILAMDLPADSSVKPSVLAKLAGYAAGAGRFSRVLQLLDRISEYPARDEATRARMAQQRAYATFGLHGFDAALPQFREALSIAEGSGDQTLLVQLSSNLGNNMLMHGRTEPALDVLRAAYEMAGRTGCESRLHHAAGVYAAGLVRRGLLYDARAVVEDVDVRPSEFGGLHSYYVALPMLEIGSMLDEKELVDRALEIPIVELAFRGGESQRIAPVATRFAQHFWRSGEPERARTLLRQAMKRVSNVRWNHCFCIAVAECGDLEDIARARRLLVRDSAKETAIAGAYIDLFDALVARRRGKQALASERGLRAASNFANLKWPFFEARALEAAGDRSAALHLYQAMGDARDAARIRTTAQPAKRSRARAAVLTDRERAVAALAVQGLPSKKIAGSLGIGVRTVEHHLQGIYGKLGVRSRWQIPADLNAHP